MQRQVEQVVEIPVPQVVEEAKFYCLPPKEVAGRAARTGASGCHSGSASPGTTCYSTHHHHSPPAHAAGKRLTLQYSLQKQF